MFGQKRTISVEHEILKENHETLVRDYQSLQERSKLEDETYEIVKKHLQSKSKELEVSNIRLSEGIEKERSEKEKCKKMIEEMKRELVIKKQELLLAKTKKVKEFDKMEKMETNYVALGEKLGVVEEECAYLKSLYDAEVAASGTPSAVMSGIGDTENLIGQGENEVNHNVNKDETDAIVISDESDGEHGNNPVSGSNITPQLSVARNQEEESKNKTKSSNENQATREIFTPGSVNHPPPFSASPSSSSSSSSSSLSSSSSDGYDDVFKVPADWPDWAISKGPGEESKKL